MNQNRSLFLSIALLFLSAVCLFGQEEKKISFAVYFTPKLSIPQFQIEELSDYDPQIGVNVQAGIDYRIDDRMSLSIGLKYRFDRIINIDYSPLFACDLINGVNSDPFNSWLEDELDLHYIGVPTTFKYYITQKKNRIYANLGYEYMIKIKETQSSVLIECGMNELGLGDGALKPISKSRGNVNLGIGIEINTAGRSTLTIEPEVSYSIIEIYESGLFQNSINNIKLFDIGLKVGVRL